MKKLTTKRNAVLTLLVGATFTMIGWSQNWVTLDIKSVDIDQKILDATGQASTVLPAGLAFVTIATALVLFTSRRILSAIIGILNLAVAVSLISLIMSFIADPVVFELKQLSNMTGIADSSALHQLISGYSLGFGLWLTVVGAVITALGSAMIFFGVRKWRFERSRFDTQKAELAQSVRTNEISTLDAWDEMTRGTDPTS